MSIEITKIISYLLMLPAFIIGVLGILFYLTQLIKDGWIGRFVALSMIMMIVGGLLLIN